MEQLQEMVLEHRLSGGPGQHNLLAVKDFFAAGAVDSTNYQEVECSDQAILVQRGQQNMSVFNHPSLYSYGFVPLGFIVSGNIIVDKGGKSTKRLSAGDFIGLFETSDWIATGQTRQIGDWTLRADGNVKILYFSKKLLAVDTRAAEVFREYLLQLAKADQVPQPNSSLPLLDWVASHTTSGRLSDYLIIAHTHLLPNNFPLFRHLAHLVGFGRTFALEKPYSTVRETRDQLIQSGWEVVGVRLEPALPYEHAVQKSLEILWSKVIEELGHGEIKNILVIDDGGDIWQSIPWERLHGTRIVGVEQTQRGVSRITNTRLHIPPIVSVASSDIKKKIESVFIGKSIVHKLFAQKRISPNMRIGIIGMGSIGRAVATGLATKKMTIEYYDPTGQAIPFISTPAPSLDALLNACDLIIGTTGTDALKGIAFDRVTGRKTFVSASSADIEFLSVLKMADPTNEPFTDRLVRIHSNLSVTILNGGFPFNFDRSGDATPSEDIVLTRCLMYIAAMQAVQTTSTDQATGKIVPLDLVAQAHTLEKWLQAKQNTNQALPITQDELASLRKSLSSTNTEVTTVWEN